MDIVAEKRNDFGKNYNLKLRKNLKIPAVIYFSGSSIPIVFDSLYSKDILNNFYNGKKFFNISILNEKYFVLLKDFYKHPFKDSVLHFDFQKVESDNIVNTNVFFKFVGEKNSVGIKLGGFLIKHKLSIGIECRVSNLPDFIEVDVTNLGVNNSIFLTDLVIPDFIKIPLLNRNGVKLKILIASIVGPRASEQKSQEIKSNK